MLKIWDRRHKNVCQNIEAHTAEIMSVDFSPFDENLMVTGSVDKSVGVWDIRNTKTKLFSLRKHRDDVNWVKFSTNAPNLIASASSDRRVMMWDLSKCGKEETTKENQKGSSDLIFSHGGHTAKISDISWNRNERLMMASVAEDNVLQIW